MHIVGEHYSFFRDNNKHFCQILMIQMCVYACACLEYSKSNNSLAAHAVVHLDGEDKWFYSQKTLQGLV